MNKTFRKQGFLNVSEMPKAFLSNLEIFDFQVFGNFISKTFLNKTFLPVLMPEKELDYLLILKALNEIPFGVGKKLLIDFLNGNEDNESIKRNKLYNLDNFGSMAYDKDELTQLIDNLIMNKLIQTTSVNQNKFWKVMELSQKGRDELVNPELYKKKLSYNFKEITTDITEQDKQLFTAFSDFLGKYNDEQKKAIISNKKHILCIAGAGSGKTTVLTKRIEFLIKYRSIPVDKILAITFTRKARQEMINRLGDEVIVETFNSFCEKILRKHNHIIYDQTVRVINYKDKIGMINRALSDLKINIDRAIDTYFTYAQKRSKTNEQLANIFMNDCFFIRDYFKFKHRKIDRAAFQTSDIKHEKSANLVYSVCNFIESFMQKNGLRDFADQLIDAIALFEHNKELIPEFQHILIDEYQDVNSTQIKLIDLLDPENILAVGDPRQSIYGWRGSDIKYILNFQDKYPDCEIITLKKNYRSSKHIVDLINKSIKNMSLTDLETSIAGKKDIRLLKFDSEDAEFEFVLKTITSSKIPRNEIFVLARTNRQLNELSILMKSRRINHLVRSDEMKRSDVAKENDVTLATIHSIKGLEAKLVFVIGCSSNNFPCKGSEHPVIEMVKVDEYDKEEEERRLFYVAMSRAKESLYISYSGKNPTYFITDDMLEIIGGTKQIDESRFTLSKSNDLITRLKDWRRQLSQEQDVPAYIIMLDRTIIDLAVKNPLTKEDLEKVMGLGPIKIMKYGDAILDMVNS